MPHLSDPLSVLTVLPDHSWEEFSAFETLHD